MSPRPWNPIALSLLARLKPAYGDVAGVNVVWLADGLDHGSAGTFAEGLLGLAGGSANLEVIAAPVGNLPLALASPQIEGGRIKVTALRSAAALEAKVVARALAANGRSLAETTLTLARDGQRGEGYIDLPLELRNEVERIELAGERSAAAVYLLDDRWRRKTVGLIAGNVARSCAAPALARSIMFRARSSPMPRSSSPSRPPI